jgi:2-polyprenyl-3-methyl-5-hydroxy-6-metoxy-1,4-benzoquinol methylase
MSNVWNDWFGNYEILLPLYRIWDGIEVGKYGCLLRGISLNTSLELGCGSGILTKYLMREKVDTALLVDYSEKALSVAKKNLKGHNGVRFLKENILDLDLKQRFDLVQSQGLIEHYKGEQQIEIIKKHIQFVRDRGFLLLVVPRVSRMYMLWRLCGSIVNGGSWVFGYEEPIDPLWLEKIVSDFGLDLIREKRFCIEYGGLWKKE